MHTLNLHHSATLLQRSITVLVLLS